MSPSASVGGGGSRQALALRVTIAICAAAVFVSASGDLVDPGNKSSLVDAPPNASSGNGSAALLPPFADDARFAGEPANTPLAHSSAGALGGRDVYTRMPASAVAAALRERRWPTKPLRWASSIAAFVRMDRASPPPHGGIVFVGSSTIRLWRNLSIDFEGLGVIGRGFGGSQLPDSTFYAQKIIAPHRPRQVVLFAGSNDLAAGRLPDAIAEDFRFFVEVARSLAPQARLSFIEITSSPSRWRLREATEATNARIRQLCTEHDVDFIAVRDQLLAQAEKAELALPRPELFAQDRLHLSSAGYRILANAVRPYLLPWPVKAAAAATAAAALPSPPPPLHVGSPPSFSTASLNVGASAIDLEDEDSLLPL